MDWMYVISTEGPPDKPYLARKNNKTIQDWNSVRRTWERNLDRNDAFLGLDWHYEDITEEEANAIIARFS